VTQISELLRRRVVRSVDLTKMYLDRLRRYDPVLQCVITLCEDLAMRQARKADEEIAALKLASMGAAIDKLTPAQKRYLAGWEEGT
jgi:Asp-tRNA(Asn)/Glu-tRNA(Gln) amidotransferase A subunit family amidase